MKAIQAPRNWEWRAIFWIGIVAGIPAFLSFIAVLVVLTYRFIMMALDGKSQANLNEAMFQTIFNGFGLVVAFLSACAALASAWLTYRLIRLQRQQMDEQKLNYEQELIAANERLVQQREQTEIDRKLSKNREDILMVREHLVMVSNIANAQKLARCSTNLASASPVVFKHGKEGLEDLVEVMRSLISLMILVKDCDMVVKKYFMEYYHGLFGHVVDNFYISTQGNVNLENEIKALIYLHGERFTQLKAEIIDETGFDVLERYQTKTPAK